MENPAIEHNEAVMVDSEENMNVETNLNGGEESEKFAVAVTEKEGPSLSIQDVWIAVLFSLTPLYRGVKELCPKRMDVMFNWLESIWDSLAEFYKTNEKTGIFFAPFHVLIQYYMNAVSKMLSYVRDPRERISLLFPIYYAAYMELKRTVRDDLKPMHEYILPLNKDDAEFVYEETQSLRYMCLDINTHLMKRFFGRFLQFRNHIELYFMPDAIDNETKLAITEGTKTVKVTEDTKTVKVTEESESEKESSTTDEIGRKGSDSGISLPETPKYVLQDSSKK